MANIWIDQEFTSGIGRVKRHAIRTISKKLGRPLTREERENLKSRVQQLFNKKND